MTKNEKWLGLIRHIITFIAGFLVWQGTISMEISDFIIAGTLMVATLIFSWNSTDKETRMSQLWGTIRHILTTLAGLGALGGWYNEDIVLTVIAIVIGLLGGGWSYLDKVRKKEEGNPPVEGPAVTG
jgi:hypothetical protein